MSEEHDKSTHHDLSLLRRANEVLKLLEDEDAGDLRERLIEAYQTHWLPILPRDLPEDVRQKEAAWRRRIDRAMADVEREWGRWQRVVAKMSDDEVKVTAAELKAVCRGAV